MASSIVWLCGLLSWISCAQIATSSPADDWPHFLGPHMNGVWGETGTIDEFPAEGPEVVWRQSIAHGYGGPAVARGRLFVMDYVIRGGDPTPDPGRRNQLQGTERILCLDANTGSELWKVEYDEPYNISYPNGPRCTPTVDGDYVFTLGSEGRLMCLRIRDGSEAWSRRLKADYNLTEAPFWGYSSHLLVHGDLLFSLVGGRESTVVAFNKHNGQEVWRALTAEEPGYCPPILIKRGPVEQLVVWTPESINGLNPQTGEVSWSFPLVPQYGMSIAPPRLEGDYLYACGIGSASILIRFHRDAPTAEMVWSGKGFNTSFSPIYSADGHAYGVDTSGKLRCIELLTGNRKWETTEPTTGGRPANSGSGFIVRNGDRFFIAGENGVLTIARMSPEKYETISSAKLLEPTQDSFGRPVVWCQPAYAQGCIFWRNDKEIICVSLKKQP
ncbi:MAG TPA: PQQ-binding-like beta-propeller repeat protein [Pirellulaceae bacterium]|nr:PQQ-binding-like beta-propeller repeat protein [Pirellulaceae bacterium]